MLFVADILCKLPTLSQAGLPENIDRGKTTGGERRKSGSQDGVGPSPVVSPMTKHKSLMSPMLLSPPSNTESTNFAELKKLLESVSNRQRWCQQSMELIMAAQSSGVLRPSEVHTQAQTKKRKNGTKERTHANIHKYIHIHLAVWLLFGMLCVAARLKYAFMVVRV